jgi:hypothetical protein
MLNSFLSCNDKCIMSSIYLHLTIPSFVLLISILLGSLIKSKMSVFKYILFVLVVFSIIVYLLYYLLNWTCDKKYKTLTYLIFILILTPIVYSGYTSIDQFDKLIMMHEVKK